MKAMNQVVIGMAEDDCFSETNIDTSAGKELRQKTLESLKKGLGRLWRRHKGIASITEYDPSYKVAYLGNVLTGWAKGEGCVEKPMSTLWRNYVSSSKPDVTMRLTVTNGGLTATTKDHGLTEYWAHRVTYCSAPASHPRIFVWVYRHEGRRLRPELRCHAALCTKESISKRLAGTLNARLHQALLEFRREKVSKQNARLSLANAAYENPSLPRRKILLSTGGQNYKPPLEKTKSGLKLSAIEEDSVAEEIEQERLLEELRSFENVARSWRDQGGWRLTQLVDALKLAGVPSDYLDENGTITSGCKTENLSEIEMGALPNVDNHSRIESASRIDRRILLADQVTQSSSLTKRRRHFQDSSNLSRCIGSPRFLCSPVIDRKGCSSLCVSVSNDLLRDDTEVFEMKELSNMYEFEDAEVFHKVKIHANIRKFDIF